MKWVRANRSAPEACALFDRHYSRSPGAVGKPNCAPPGRVLVLVSDDERALWVSRVQDRDACRHAWPGSWECSAFRNEGETLSSDLIREAVAVTREAWGIPPPEGFITFVDASKIRSTNPGCCYLAAGWQRLKERTQDRGLVVLHLAPEAFPVPAAALGTQRGLFA